MTVILFLVDTSASMHQNTLVNGVRKSYLDIAKAAVETFINHRQRFQDCQSDRYMLLTFEDWPCNIKTGWMENHITFMNELNNLQCNDLTSMGESLKNAFELLNLNRMQSGIDTYGQGRCPFHLTPSFIIVLTDGGLYSFKDGVHKEIILPANSHLTGATLTKEPFRWDQRIFSLVLRIPGVMTDKIVNTVNAELQHDDSPIEKMCAVTGGRSYLVKSQFDLDQCIESLVPKAKSGVVLHFQPLLIPKDLQNSEDIVFASTKKMIYVQKHPTEKTFPVGYWPFPESYWSDPKASTLPPRDAHPKIRVVAKCVEVPQSLRNFPVDEYEIETSGLTLQILSKREATKCWPVIIANGLKDPPPFGYLKATPNFTHVHLYVTAYNYPLLLPLMYDYVYSFALSPPREWIDKFTAYCRSIPQYYFPFLRRALLKIDSSSNLLQFILTENMHNYINPNIAYYLKEITNAAKNEQEMLCLRVFNQLKHPKPPYRQIETAKLNSGQSLKSNLVSNPLLRETFSKLHNEIKTYKNHTIVVPTMARQASAENYQNPFEIPRRDLIDQLDHMREMFIKNATAGISLLTKDAGHCLPIAEMGEYQKYLINQPKPLREVEPKNVRKYIFGNPYKRKKHTVDEVEFMDLASPVIKCAPHAPGKSESTPRKRKRKAGPLPNDYIFQRSSSSSSLSHSSTISESSWASDTNYEDGVSETSSVLCSDDSDSDPLVDAFDSKEPEDSPINRRDFEDSSDRKIQTEPSISKLIAIISNNSDVSDNIMPPLVYGRPTNIHQHATAVDDLDASKEERNHVITEEDIEMEEIRSEKILQKNLKLRSLVLKDIRRPGRDYSSLLNHLRRVKGNFHTKYNFIQMCIHESLLFRRKRMATDIQKWWENQIENTLAEKG